MPQWSPEESKPKHERIEPKYLRGSSPDTAISSTASENSLVLYNASIQGKHEFPPLETPAVESGQSTYNSSTTAPEGRGEVPESLFVFIPRVPPGVTESDLLDRFCDFPHPERHPKSIRHRHGDTGRVMTPAGHPSAYDADIATKMYDGMRLGIAK
ncbi:hypothetical protein FRB96_003944 [Tulasnella sp. 330]|nr:hypothetical protein FRB96_003944 [Tulasnella sp. 330]KAG8871993.1 hypothetical protein FRB97_008117 [Tulasnella sp. 331]